MSDSMVERVARAILAGHDWMASHEDDDGWSDPQTFDDMTPDWQEAYRNQARAAIAAMRDCTPKMRRAMATAMSPGKRPTEHRVSSGVKHKVRWRAAIDAALEATP